MEEPAARPDPGEPAPAAAARKPAGAAARPAERSEFQKFIAENSGQDLPNFGADFFANAPSTFAPIANSPVPSEYPLGPGDELLIRGWGTIDIDYRAKIDRNGLVNIPRIGSIVLGGVRAGHAERVIQGAVAKLYKGVTLNVNFGQLRAITVYVVGQARRPGTYTVSSMSTLVTALFASGGPNAGGSMRRVQVKRAGAVAAELDLYSFIAKGDKSADIKLHDGDVIVIPAAAGHVALVGKVNRPAVYELRGAADTVGALLDLAGGLPVVADPRRAFLERIDAGKSQPRSVERFALNAEGLARALKDGDVLNITSITPDFSNAVVLRGNVDQAIRTPFRAGMRVGDLIPNREYLITRSSILRQNSAVGAGDDAKPSREGSETIAARIGGLIDEINWDYAVVERINRADLSVELIPFNLGSVFSDPSGADNVRLQAGDTVTIFSQQDVLVPMAKRRVFVRVEGEVNVPGVYQMTSGENLHALMARAGGPTASAYLLGTAFYRDQVRREQEANLEKAAARLESRIMSEQSFQMANLGDAPDQSRLKAELQASNDAVARLRRLKPTGRINFGMDPDARSFGALPRLKLENGDRLVVPSRPDFVHVFGAVSAESSPLWRPNTRVADYIKVSGLEPAADAENIFIVRVDGSVISRPGSWLFDGISAVEVMPGDSIVVPERMDRRTGWVRFMQGTREWAQVFANFGLGAAALKVLK
ncbi:polysaccharide export protein [Massilia glaciei]|uniref:Polysaccharide export protein n=2 Tax=Massilia glaciei TaxID=1524097 RepID=A0A2U2HN47_9BURK|nr:polysaccharide export protein [Massilia glaciei]